MIKKNIIGAALAVLVLAGTSYAQESTEQGNSSQGQGSSEEHSRRAPSQVAIDACSGKAVGDTCEYTNSRGEDKTGACANTSDGQTVFCKRIRKTAS
jgi:hypothetical protein